MSGRVSLDLEPSPPSFTNAAGKARDKAGESQPLLSSSAAVGLSDAAQPQQLQPSMASAFMLQPDESTVPLPVFARNSMIGNGVESAEDILQAVEAQLEQSPLLSRRSSLPPAMVMARLRPGCNSALAPAPGSVGGAASATGAHAQGHAPPFGAASLSSFTSEGSEAHHGAPPACTSPEYAGSMTSSLVEMRAQAVAAAVAAGGTFRGSEGGSSIGPPPSVAAATGVAAPPGGGVGAGGTRATVTVLQQRPVPAIPSNVSFSPFKASSSTVPGPVFRGGSWPAPQLTGDKKVPIAGVRTWLKVFADGSSSIVQLDRNQLGVRYGVQLRDFRVLDPVLGASYPSCLLCREGAIIVNLDHIKVIITAHFVLVNHAESDKVRSFVDELKRRMQRYSKGIPAPSTPSNALPQQQQRQSDSGLEAAAAEAAAKDAAQAAAASAADGSNGASKGLGGVGQSGRSAGQLAQQAAGHLTQVASTLISKVLPAPMRHVGSLGNLAVLSASLPGAAAPSASAPSAPEAPVSELVAMMPFELRALEVVLEQTVSLLDAQSSELERATRMGLDELTLRVNPRNLERMRHLKGRMAQLTSKVDTARGVLEKLMDDDKDMAAMCLTAKEEAAAEAEQVAQMAEAQQAMMDSNMADAVARGGTAGMRGSMGPLRPDSPPMQIGRRSHGIPATYASGRGTPEGGGSMCWGPAGGGGGHSTISDHSDSEEIAVVEMLLEAYFMQLGHTWQRLQSLTSYIDSTEDLINLELDQQRNNLISIDLMVTFGSFLLTAMSVIAGLFGMNVTNRLETNYRAFLEICIGSAATAVTLWTLFVYAAIRYGLMNGLSR